MERPSIKATVSVSSVTSTLRTRSSVVTAEEFIPFLCAGLLVWNLISSIITESGGLFTGSESYIKQVRLPYSVYVYRFIWSKIIIFAHNVVIYFGVLLYFRISPGWVALLAFPGFALLLLNGALTTLYIGMVSARFRTSAMNLR